MSQAFDREWQLGELLDGPLLEQFGANLRTLLASELAISDAAGQTLWGIAPPDAQRLPLILELEPIGYLLGHARDSGRLTAARNLLQIQLRAQVRFRMASSLHLEAVAEDFESLRREHARLSESEARYKALSEELEERVRQQVAVLEERQQMLYQAEKLASVGQLAAGMAHEINNPLGFVRSNLSTFTKYLEKLGELKIALGEDLAAWQTLDLDFVLEDGVDLLQESAKGLERIARIVADLKSFSNVDRASEEFTDLNDCLQQAAGIVEKQLPAGINIQLDLLPLPRLICLPGHINQLFFNVIRNAMQAIQDAGRPGSIRISSEANEAGIAIRIRDDGIGMQPAQLERAFEPFYTTRPVGAGVGLGLSTARNIVLAHSGRITLDSQPDGGTTVSIFFPAPP